MRRQCYVVGDGNSSPKDVQEDCEQQDGLELLELERSSLRANMFSRGNIERRNSTSEAYLALKDATNVACSSLFNNNNITSQATSVSRFSRTIKKPRRYVQNIEEKENVWNRGKKYKSSLDKTKGLGECKEITMVDMDIEVMEAIAVEGMHLMDIDEIAEIDGAAGAEIDGAAGTPCHAHVAGWQPRAPQLDGPTSYDWLLLALLAGCLGAWECIFDLIESST
ncbi:hypothetical protein L7F22_061954 [Adiantum nelumboides]|nr:hypothetical protein [Adiantum nelumboides]